MKITFDKATVVRMIAHAKAAPDHRKCYGDKKKEPALHLVGDQGVYLMSNGVPQMPDPSKPNSSEVAYAHQCNPDKMEFDEWYDNKRTIFGGDDGVISLDVASLEKALSDKGRSGPKSKTFNLWITPSQVSF